MVSDGVYLLLYYVIGYRKKIVGENLAKAFPEKGALEREQLRKEFYRYFCDLVLETFKTLTISKNSMLRHCSMDQKSLDLLNSFAVRGESVILVLGHHGNWEWAGNTFSLSCMHRLYVIYHPLSNPYFNGLMYRMRTRFGTRLISMQDTYKEMVRHRGELTATAFIADQTPQPGSAHWMSFLHQDTPVFLGTERIATRLKRTVLYVSVQKIKRGYYRLVIDEHNILDPQDFEAGGLTEAHTRRLEEEIRLHPETWLWTHRRWKHQRNQDL